MRNLLVILIVIASGFVYGWTIVTYPLTGQFIAGFLGCAILFILGVAYVTNKK
jgi:hypothetical protein